METTIKYIIPIASFLVAVIGYGIKIGVLTNRLKNTEDKCNKLEDLVDNKIQDLTNAIALLTTNVAVLTEQVKDIKERLSANA